MRKQWLALLVGLWILFGMVVPGVQCMEGGDFIACAETSAGGDEWLEGDQAREIAGVMQPETKEALEETLQDYVEPVPGARQRVEQVLRIMLTAWIATRMRQEAETMLSTIL